MKSERERVEEEAIQREYFNKKRERIAKQLEKVMDNGSPFFSNKWIEKKIIKK